MVDTVTMQSDQRGSFIKSEKIRRKGMEQVLNCSHAFRWVWRLTFFACQTYSRMVQMR